ncbi:hypothetical protein AAG570_013969 [Ranatra chinensis]|uniref:C2H2-type domain-containing protein n=1 Tax=Ranatra chinensis TaxID=642074 RepID=A0ABD0Z000_9HEMI
MSQKVLECERCGRKYKHAHHLRSHVKYECGQAPRFQCSQCPFRSNQPSEHEFQCQDCGRAYRQQKSLYSHQKYECGKKAQFQCSYCPHRSKRRYDLAKHYKFKHDPNAEFYYCKYCSWHTKYKDTLEFHELNKHSRPNYKH